jgi:enamine deaminase RidA (YjgF/YER057c/UK114 family)
VYARLAALAIELPKPAAPAAKFEPFVKTGNLVFVSGHIARREGVPWTGRLGEGMSVEDGRMAARSVAVDLLGTLQAAAGDLGRVRRIVKLLVLVNAAPSFTEAHLVANGASELLLDVFGPAGAHARSAFGAAQIPLGSCVEIELVAELDSEQTS